MIVVESSIVVLDVERYNGGLMINGGEKFVVLRKQAKALKPANVLPAIDRTAFGLPSLGVKGNARAESISGPPKKAAGRVLGNRIPCFATLERAVPVA